MDGPHAVRAGTDRPRPCTSMSNRLEPHRATAAGHRSRGAPSSSAANAWPGSNYPVGIVLLLGTLQFSDALTVWVSGSPTASIRQPGAMSVPRQFLVVAIIVAVQVVGYWAVVRFIGRRPVVELGRTRALGEFLTGVALVTALYAGVAGVLALAGVYRIVSVGWGEGIITWLALALIAGFSEELIFRGLLLRLVERCLGTW